MPARFLAALVPLVLVAGCVSLGADEPAADAGPGASGGATDAMTEGVAEFPFTGTVTGTPATPGVAEFPVTVEQGAIEVQATLTWANAPASNLRLALLDPEGEVVASGFPESDGRRSAATTDPPASGEWTVRVTGDRALDEAFDVLVRVSYIVPGDNVLADSVELRAGGFAELNLIMEENAVINWSFESTNGPVKWNVHSHENGETEYHSEGLDESYAASFTAPKRFIYSLMFESTAPTTLSYTVEGQFRVHSHSQ